MTTKLIIPSAINLLAFVNETLVSSRRRGFDGEVTLPSLRERAKAVVHEVSLMKLEVSETTIAVGELTP